MEFYSGQHLSANCLNGLVTRVNNLCNQLRALQGRQATANLGKTYFPRRASEGGGDVGYWTRMPINLPPFTRFDVVRYCGLGCEGGTEVESYLQGGSWVSGVEGIHTLPTVRLCKREPALLYIEPTEYRSVEGGTAGLGLSLYASCSYFAFPNLQLLADERCKFSCVPINQLCKVICRDDTGSEFCRMEFKKASLRLFKQYWAGDIHRPDLYDIRKEHFGYSVDLECSTISISQGVAVLYPPVIQSGCTPWVEGYVYGNSEFMGCSLHPRMVLIPCATIRTSLSDSSVLTYFYRCDCSSCEKPSAWTTNIENCNGCVIGTCTTCWTLPDPCYNYGYNWRNECKSAMYVPCWDCAGGMLQFYDFDTEVNYSGWSDPCFHACKMNIGRNGHNHPEIVPIGRFYTRTEIAYNTCGCVMTEADGSKTSEVLSEVHQWRTFCVNKTPMVIYDRSLNGIGTFWRWYSDCGRERDIECVRAMYYAWATGATTCCRLVPCLWERACARGECNRLAVSRVAMTDVCKCLPPQYFYVPAPKDCWYNYNTEVNDG